MVPASRLADLIEHFWIVRWDLRGLPPQVREVLPHPNVHLTIDSGGAKVYGIQTGRFSRVLRDRGSVFGVKFRPGAFRPLFGRPVSELRDRCLPGAQVLGAAVTDLELRISLEESNDAAMVEEAERWLSALGVRADPHVACASAIVDWIAAERAVARVEQVAERWNLNPRGLQRLFREYVGAPPKWVINRYRLHEALERLAAAGPIDWPGLAVDLGYFDQAHFIRDFKALTGRTPAEYARRG